MLLTTYFIEGVYLAILGILTIMRGIGQLDKEWYRYLVPSIGLLTSLILPGFLVASYPNELSKIGYIGATDVQLRPHLFISIILGIASIVAFIGLTLRIIWFDVATLLALLTLSIVFITQSQYGSNELTIKITRMVGISLMVGIFIHGGATFISKWYKLFTVIVGLIFLFGAALLILSSAFHNL